MSALHRTLERRLARDVAQDFDQAPEVHALAVLRRGGHAEIVGVDTSCGPVVARRLLDLGFVPGARIEHIRRAPLGDPTVYRVADYEIALRRGLSRTIAVRPLP